MPLEGAHLCTETRGFNVPLILVMPVSRLYREVDQLEGEATPYFMPVATLETPLSSSLLAYESYAIVPQQ
jgi:hypothetical protein